MTRKLALLLLGLAPLACGPAEGLLSLAVTRQGLASVDVYDVRVLGNAVTCSAVDAAPATFQTLRTCSVSEAETAQDCHISHAMLEPGATNRLDSISAGKRVVFVVGLDGAKVPVAKGCAEVEVKDGAASRISITVSDGF